MKNTYIIAAVIIVVAVIGLFIKGQKTSAPVEDLSTPLPADIKLADGIYKVDTSTSTLRWSGEILGGITETGSVAFREGKATVEGGSVKSAEFTFDMQSIKDDAGKSMLENHLKSKDFFNTQKYATSTFVLKTFAPTSEEGAKAGRFVVSGDLTVKGITVPISFLATVTSEGKDSIRAIGSFAINRTDWEITYKSNSFFSDLKDGAIRDAVQIDLNIVATKK
jgi:polyisoprenoid-binding protein YceI